MTSVKSWWVQTSDLCSVCYYLHGLSRCDSKSVPECYWNWWQESKCDGCSINHPSADYCLTGSHACKRRQLRIEVIRAAGDTGWNSSVEEFETEDQPEARREQPGPSRQVEPSPPARILLITFCKECELFFNARNSAPAGKRVTAIIKCDAANERCTMKNADKIPHVVIMLKRMPVQRMMLPPGYILHEDQRRSAAWTNSQNVLLAALPRIQLPGYPPILLRDARIEISVESSDPIRNAPFWDIPYTLQVPSSWKPADVVQHNKAVSERMGLPSAGLAIPDCTDNAMKTTNYNHIVIPQASFRAERHVAAIQGTLSAQNKKEVGTLGDREMDSGALQALAEAALCVLDGQDDFHEHTLDETIVDDSQGDGQ